MPGMRITALAGGVGGARFLRGLLHHVRSAGIDAELTVVGNTADDITLHGLRVCPDLDTVMYTLGGGIHEGQGWGPADERFTVAEEFAAYGEGPDWFTLGDRDLATHVVRTRLLGQGLTLTEVTARLSERWGLPELGVRLLPMSDDRVETHVEIEDAEGLRAIHFQEWWVRLHAAVPARRILALGVESARPAPGVLDAIRTADVVLLPPSNPVVSIGTILGVPGIRHARRAARGARARGRRLPHRRRRTGARHGRRLPDRDRCRDHGRRGGRPLRGPARRVAGRHRGRGAGLPCGVRPGARRPGRPGPAPAHDRRPRHRGHRRRRPAAGRRARARRLPMTGA